MPVPVAPKMIIRGDLGAAVWATLAIVENWEKESAERHSIACLGVVMGECRCDEAEEIFHCKAGMSCGANLVVSDWLFEVILVYVCTKR